MNKIDELLFLHERLEENPDFLKKSKSIDELLEIKQGIEHYLTPLGGVGLALTGTSFEANKEKLRSVLIHIKAIIFERDGEAPVLDPVIKGSNIKLSENANKINLLMTLDALCEMGFFVIEGTNKRATREALLAAIGQALNEDFSKAGQALSIAYGQNEETNLAFFVKAAEVVRKKMKEKLERGKNK